MFYQLDQCSTSPDKKAWAKTSPTQSSMEWFSCYVKFRMRFIEQLVPGLILLWIKIQKWTKVVKIMIGLQKWVKPLATRAGNLMDITSSTTKVPAYSPDYYYCWMFYIYMDNWKNHSVCNPVDSISYWENFFSVIWWVYKLNTNFVSITNPC